MHNYTVGRSRTTKIYLNILGIIYPSLDEIAQSIAKRDKARIIPTGVQTLNRLGLSAQVPMSMIYLTDGSPREIKVANGKIKLKKAALKSLAVKGEISGLVIQALEELGKNGILSEKILQIKDILKNENPNHLIPNLLPFGSEG